MKSSNIEFIKTIQSISIKEFFEKHATPLKLELIAGKEGLHREIKAKIINRPGLALAGYFKHFGENRIQFFGIGEMGFLSDLPEERRCKILEEFAQKSVPCIVTNKDGNLPKEMLSIADKYQIPLFYSELTSHKFLSIGTQILDEIFAERILVHGTLIDIKGIGVLMEGKSGVGKSECALALLERGYSLISDDVTYFRKKSDNEIFGYSPSLNREYMECRGLGIINVVQLFGIRSFRPEKRLDLVITFVDWAPGMEEDRTGLEQSFKKFLGIDVPNVKIPVRPGRDMARLVEVAALIQSLRNMGHDPATEFNEKLIALMSNKS